MSRLERYEKFFGDIVPRDRREAIAEGEPEDRYLNMAIEKPKPRKSEDFEGKPLGKRAQRKLLRELREEYGRR